MKSIMVNLWHPVRGVQILDLGAKSDSFCEEKMAFGVEIAEMGWDLSLQAQSRRARALKQNQFTMDHDAEEGALMGEKGKKRPRGEIEGLIVGEEPNHSVLMNRRMLGSNLLSSVAAKRQANRAQ
ncbi:hypothetical protein Gotri_021569 [Gossypium trilobum]|uniref:Uncharacterized protein n=1 Tax=Gossypium trilobum TaxID=34281 RepID=A0A7J9DCW8_9ROSI|nr:hypothetical protein [Gossypium trilobum]